LEVEIAVNKLKMYKLPGINQIPPELSQARGKVVYSEIQKHIDYIWNDVELPQQWREFITIPIYEKSDQPDCSNY
jgi:hypothetical protein